MQLQEGCNRTRKEVCLGSRNGQNHVRFLYNFSLKRPGLFSLEKCHWRVSIGPNITWEKKEQWPLPPSSCTRNKGQQTRTQVANLTNEMPCLGLTLNAPWQVSLDMHKQVQNGNVDKLTKPGCIKCSDNVVATFGHSSLEKQN